MRERDEYFPHLVNLARYLMDGGQGSMNSPQQLREMGTDLKEMLTVVGILYERELGRQALENFREATRPPCRR